MYEDLEFCARSAGRYRQRLQQVRIVLTVTGARGIRPQALSLRKRIPGMEPAATAVPVSGGIFHLKKDILWGIGATHRAVNSAGECYLHTVEVTGSNPVPPTIEIKGLAIYGWPLFFFCDQIVTGMNFLGVLHNNKNALNLFDVLHSS